MLSGGRVGIESFEDGSKFFDWGIEFVSLILFDKLDELFQLILFHQQ